MRKGFLYLIAIMDWFTRMVLAWRTSNTLEVEFCLEALNDATHKFGPPEMRIRVWPSGRNLTNSKLVALMY